MEAVEDPTLEPAIGWLADTILANLAAGGKLNSWIRQAGLGNDVEKLRSEVEEVEMVVSAVQGRSAGNKPLAKSLTAFKELLYDADDVVDELDGYRLQQELQPPETLLETDGRGTQQTVENSRENADDVQSSDPSRLRSKEWIHFEITEFEQNGGPSRARCKYCQKEIMCNTKMGTSVLRNHLKSKGCSHKRGASDPSSSTADATTIPVPVVTGSRKRMRTGQESTHITAANPNGWNKDAFSERIQDITSQLQGKHGAITRLLKILPSDSVGASSSHCQTTTSDPRRRTSGLFHGKVYGRAAEKRSIKKWIKEHKSTTGVTVLPIVGIGGVGKTALAQLVYNDSAVKSHFDHKIWIWVSKDFDEMRLTREMLDCVSQETYDGLCSLTKLQEALKGHIKSKRVLLILDDVWEVMDNCRWNKLLAPFKSGDGANGNMIILTTRKPSVAKKRGTIGPINLDGLESDDFWLFFKACAFGDENYEEQASLSEFARQMTKRLQGNPLAAETAGTLLREHLAMDHWSNILKTGDWKSLQHTGGIMSALKLSYDELPYHLQQCFSYFSIFPYNYQFLAEELVSHWISQGFVKHDYSSKSLEEIGQQYLSGLVNLGLFEQVESERSSFGSRTQTYYAMCGLMHDFARLVSRTECATLDGFQCTEVFPTVHHLSILTNSVYRRNDQTGNIPRNEKFEFFLQNLVTSVRNLRTLVLIGEYDSFFFKAFQDVFGKAHNLHLLQMSATSPDFNSFLFSLVNPTCLRYLKLHDVHTEQRPLLSLVNPTCLWDPKLHDVPTEQKALPHVLSKFFHLQVLEVDFFKPLHTVHLDNCGEWRILPSLEMLQFLKRLKLSNMRRVREVLVPPLEELVLDGMPDLRRCSCTFVRDMKSSLRVLEIQSCPALEGFDLFQRGDNFEIDALRSSVRASSGYVADARAISVIDGVVHIPLNLRKITIARCPHIIFDGSKEGFVGFTSLEEEVEEDGQENIHLPQSLEHFAWFNYPRKALRPCFVGNLTCLRKLVVTSRDLEYLQLDSCTALEELEIHDCDQLVTLEGKQTLGTLRSLVLYENSSLESLQLHSCTWLERLRIFNCRSLVTLEGMESLVNLKHLEILYSPVALEVEGLQSLVNLKHLKIRRSSPLKSLTALESIEPTEGISSQGYELFPALESLHIDDLSPLTTSFCKGLTCLRSLKLCDLDATRLTDEQEDALLLLRSLQELCFHGCVDLVDLPAGLHDLPSLKTLEIGWCRGISTLSKEALPPSLEELVINWCSVELSEQCRSLATKLEVKIDGRYVD